ncbi:hypothetical protein MKY66_25965 [Paenibacillus sp. FSL R5-0766]|uniref:hypothetical protein n=1 Tax=unclassified Paenibacillus TaxID=185978 RepID=UPI00096E9828|nr:hypothetical protein [Paenibacillus sp. FSL R5-0765]OMF63846.1 hypothetical protein BK141_16645 [Paenibacillus sp. FSL R5-0765]
MYEGTPYPRETFENYLVIYAADGIRLSVGTLVLFFLNVFLLIPVFSVPFQSMYAYILVPPLVFMNIWAIALIAAPRRLQLNYVLFRGVFGIVCSVGFMVIIQKFAYGTLALTTPWYAIGSFAVYGFALFQYVKFRLHKLRQPPQRKKGDKSPGMPVATLTMITGGAYLLANISLAFVTQQTVAVVLMCVYIMLAFVVFHFIMDLHRYYWLRQVMNKSEG